MSWGRLALLLRSPVPLNAEASPRCGRDCHSPASRETPGPLFRPFPPDAHVKPSEGAILSFKEG